MRRRRPGRTAAAGGSDRHLVRFATLIDRAIAVLVEGGEPLDSAALRGLRVDAGAGIIAIAGVFGVAVAIVVGGRIADVRGRVVRGGRVVGVERLGVGRGQPLVDAVVAVLIGAVEDLGRTRVNVVIVVVAVAAALGDAIAVVIAMSDGASYAEAAQEVGISTADAKRLMDEVRAVMR